MINKHIIVGRLGRNPEIRTFPDGEKIANMSVATSLNYKDKQTGEWKGRTEWHRIVVRSKGLIEKVLPNLQKGDMVYIEGRSETRKWQDQNGQDRYSTEINIAGFDSVLKRLNANGENNNSNGDQAAASAPATDQSFDVDLNDDIPF